MLPAVNFCGFCVIAGLLFCARFCVVNLYYWILELGDNSILCIAGKTQHVSCNTVLPVPYKDKRTWNAEVLCSLSVLAAF